MATLAFHSPRDFLSHCFELDGLRHKAIVSLKFITGQRTDQGLLTIVRSKALGGKLEIRLQPDVSSLTSISGKEVRRRQLKIRYGSWRQSVTLRAPTSAVFETWWAALENAFDLPNFVAIPIVDARAHQVTIAPVLPIRRNVTRPKPLAALETMVEVECEDPSIDDMPILEARGPSSPTEIDVLASWRTWGSLDYFATPPSITSSLASNDIPQGTNDDNLASNDSDTSDNNSLYSDISEFWSRSFEWEDNEPQDNPDPVAKCTTHEFNSEIPRYSKHQDDDAWLDEIALYVFRQKVGAPQSPERRERYSSNSATGQLHPLLRYAG